MNDLDYDNYQKKCLARQAFHRKGGSKSKRCPMSTDHMTPRQWEERNGKVVSVNFNRPTTWDNFKNLSKDTQGEYLRHLMEIYNASMTNFAEMFGVSTATIRRHIRLAGLDIQFHAGHSMGNRQRDAWEQFLRSDQDYIASNSITEEADAIIEEMNISPIKPMPVPMKMSEFSFCFVGPINVEMVANSLRHILEDNAQGELRIVCNLTERS